MFVSRRIKNIKWYVTNSSELRRYHQQQRFSWNVIHLILVGLVLCTIFVQKYIFFQILSQKNAQIVNLSNPDLDFIRRIHSESGIYGFMIRFWICPKKLDKTLRLLLQVGTTFLYYEFI